MRVDSLLVQPGKRKIKNAMQLSELTWSPLYGEDCEGPGVFKAEKLDHDSSTIVTIGEFEPTCEGAQPDMFHPWWDFTEEEAWDHVISGGSLFISWLPGVGKSTTCMRFIECLKKRRRAILTARTHVAARNLRSEGLEPVTLQRLNNRYLKNGALGEETTLVIDEVSQINTSLWHAICPLAALGVQIICMGNPGRPISFCTRLLGERSSQCRCLR